MITITKPGLLSSLQDLGRYGFQKYGVIASGAMDQLAHRIANLLVGNEQSDATMEITLIGPEIKFEENTLISICGGNLSPVVDDVPVRQWRTILVYKGSVLKFGPCQTGCRAYIGIAGGFSVPDVMNSKSTYLRAQIGGFKGRALKAGDQLGVNNPSTLAEKIFQYLEDQHAAVPFKELEWSVGTSLIPIIKNPAAIRVMRGRQFDWFSNESQQNFFTQEFEVSPQSDRMGYRLKGMNLTVENAAEMISEAVNFGTIQVPPEGNPIVLLADRQTSGGYPKIGQIATVDLPLLAQARPGDRLRFKEISHEQAQILYLKTEKEIQQLKQGITLKFNS